MRNLSGKTLMAKYIWRKDVYKRQDYNRLLPIDAMQEMEREGKIGKLCPFFLSTVGVMTSVERSIHLGKQIAADVIKNKVDAVLITSASVSYTHLDVYKRQVWERF